MTPVETEGVAGQVGKRHHGDSECLSSAGCLASLSQPRAQSAHHQYGEEGGSNGLPGGCREVFPITAQLQSRSLSSRSASFKPKSPPGVSVELTKKIKSAVANPLATPHIALGGLGRSWTLGPMQSPADTRHRPRVFSLLEVSWHSSSKAASFSVILFTFIFLAYLV